ncbi:thiamine phosphate synthase [Gluconobacter sp. Dm-62]|uniref:thiamine phosphate synthase n=1 Tax=Gluconobacter sp. Dm-62 TaxID=2799804 RepID=UPI001B8C1191|nr:thiamine phosphate synthase [Gluconobacter sp. Dm-62]MBS1104475.1 thiamine phosphate synthase [Gluconobacter sp. Dm-62]
MTSCDLYPVLPAGFSLDAALDVLRDVLALPEVTALRLPCGWTPEKAQLSQLVDLLHANGVAMILEVGLPLSGTSQSLLGTCDGLHAACVEDLITLRKTVGSDMAIGCVCTNRDDAMKAGESGADYVAFPAGEKELVTWWSSVMELPGVAENILTTDDGALALAAGADFLAIPLQFDGKDAERFSAMAALAAD